MTNNLKNPSIPVWVYWVLLFISSRILYMYLLHPTQLIYYEEEFIRGTLAQGFIEHWPMSRWLYRADDYYGGSLVVAWLASLSFRLFGQTAFALKLVPIGCYAVGLVAWYHVAERWFSREVANIFGLLYCAAPPMFMALSITAMAFHADTLVFSGLTLWCIELLFEHPKSARFWGFLIGFSIGFGIWYGYMYVLTLGVVPWILRHHLRRTSLPIMTGLWAFAGFLCGFSPWLYTVFTGLAHVFVIHRQSFWKNFDSSQFMVNFFDYHRMGVYRLFELFARELTPDRYIHITNRCYAYGGFFLVVSAWSIAVRNKFRKSISDSLKISNPALLWIVGYWIILGCAIQIWEEQTLRYGGVAFPWQILLAAWALSVWRHLTPRVASLYVIALVLLSWGTNAPTLSWADRGTVFTMKGYTATFIPDGVPSTPEALRVFEKAREPYLSDADKRSLRFTIAQKLMDTLHAPHLIDQVTGLASRIDPVWRPYLYYCLALQMPMESPSEHQRADAFLLKTHSPYLKLYDLSYNVPMREPGVMSDAEVVFDVWIMKLYRLDFGVNLTHIRANQWNESLAYRMGMLMAIWTINSQSPLVDWYLDMFRRQLPASHAAVFAQGQREVWRWIEPNSP